MYHPPRSLTLMPAAALTLTLGLPAPSSGQEADGPPVEVVAHAVSPSEALLGGQAVERLVLSAPEGWALDVSDAAALTGGVERLGGWHASRAGIGEGMVVWTFRAPLVAFEAGTRRTPPLRVSARATGHAPSVTEVSGVEVRILSPVAAETRVVQPAPLVDPGVPTSPWPGVLAVMPLLAAVGSGVTWLRRRGESPAPSPSSPRPPEHPTLADAREQLSHDPARAAVLAGWAVRGHPRVRGWGVTWAHTTRELLALCATPAAAQALAGALLLADAVRYARAEPSQDAVAEALAAASACLGEEGVGHA